MTPIVVSADRLEQIAYENPGLEIQIHRHTSSLRVGDVLYIASLPEPEPSRPDVDTGTEYDLYADNAVGGGER